MSYDVYLRDANGDPLPTEHFAEGGTRNLYGTNACDLNITYNYFQVFRLVGFDVKELNGRRANDTVEELRAAFDALGGNLRHPPQPYEDYWAPTPGNALRAVSRLLVFAEEHPDGEWLVA